MRIIMKFFLFFFISLSANGFDPARLQEDLKTIENEFLAETKTIKNTDEKISAKSHNISSEEELQDLESLYFDNISSRAAAPKRKTKKRLRSR